MHRRKVSMQVLLAAIHALEEHYESAHWLSQGETFYGDHLLFERLYENIEDEVDSFAERLIGFHGNSSYDPARHMEKVSKFISKWNSIDCLFRRSVYAERVLLKLLRKTYDRLDRKGGLTLGLDDLIMSVADQHERHLYLLKQKLAGK